jgi:hypothetical protein
MAFNIPPFSHWRVAQVSSPVIRTGAPGLEFETWNLVDHPSVRKSTMTRSPRFRSLPWRSASNEGSGFTGCGKARSSGDSRGPCMGERACVRVRQDQSMFSTAGRIGIGQRPWRRGNSQFPQNRLVVRRRTGRCAEDDSVCGSAKGERIWVQILSGLKRLRRSSGFRAKSAKSVPPGLKPALILLALCGG